MALAWLLAAVLLTTSSFVSSSMQYDEHYSGSHRLPRSIVPERYEIYLVPFHPGQYEFTGNATITVTAAEATDHVTLHADGLRINRVTVRTAGSREVAIDDLSASDDTRHFLVLRLREAMVPEARYHVFLEFSGVMRRSVGFYARPYIDSGDNRVMAVTLFEPTHARQAFPCFDEPSLKATFQVNIARHDHLIALSNMPLMSTSPPDPWLDHRVWDSFQESPRMSTYLVAVVVGDLKAVRTTDRRLALWVRDGARELAALSSSLTPRLLRVLEDHFGVPYALPKLDQVAVPGHTVAMENYGLVVYMETSLLHSPEWNPTSAKQGTANLVAHELAHQWFGNLVTPGWWRHLWLSEGVAQFYSYQALHQVETSWRMMDQFVVNQLQPMLQVDSMPSVDSLDEDCETPAEVILKFGAVSYMKGASVVRMMQHVLTEETFRKGIHSYLIARQYDTAAPSHLYDALQTHAAADQRLDGVGATVGELFGRWASQAGYPVVMVVRDYQQGSATVSQARFFSTSSPTTSSERWSVPLSWTSQADAPAGFASTTASAWILDHQDSVQISHLASDQEWVVFNNQQSGYYRINYDDENWRRIAAHLTYANMDDIHVLNRAQLLDDALRLARAGQLDYSVALNLTRYLARETDYIPWSSAFNGFAFLNRVLVGSEAHQAFQEYVLGLLGPLYDAVGFWQLDGEDDPHLARLSREQVLTTACQLGHEDCIRQARSLFASWGRPENPGLRGNMIHPDLKSVVYCTAVAEGGDEEWQFLWSVYDSGETAADTLLILGALGCSRDPSRLGKFLQMSIDRNHSMGTYFRRHVFTAVYNNHHGINIGLDFLVWHFDEVMKRYGGAGAVSAIIQDISGRLTTPGQVRKLSDLLASNKDAVAPGAASGRTPVEIAASNLEWKTRHYHTVAAWLAQARSQDVPAAPDSHHWLYAWALYIIFIIVQL